MRIILIWQAKKLAWPLQKQKPCQSTYAVYRFQNCGAGVVKPISAIAFRISALSSKIHTSRDLDFMLVLCWNWSPFGYHLAPVWPPFGSLLAHFWCPLAHFWRPWDHFCSPLRSIFTLLRSPGVIFNSFRNFRWVSYVNSYFLKNPHWNSAYLFLCFWSIFGSKAPEDNTRDPGLRTPPSLGPGAETCRRQPLF